MHSDYVEKVKDYRKISHGNYIVKMIDCKGLEDEVKKVNTIAVHLGSFVLGNSNRIMNNFINAIKGFYTIDVFYTDTDSLHNEKKTGLNWIKLC